MHRSRSSLLLNAALVVLVLSACAKPDEKEAPNDRMLREALQLPADARLIYADESGAPLTPEQVTQRMKEGASLVPQRDDATNTVTLRFEAKPRVVERLPQFDLARLGGGRARNSDLAGGPALVNFFFETCVPCIKEVPALNEFRRTHPEFRYLAVTHDSTTDATRFVEQRHFEWPVAAEASELIAASGVRAFPTYMLLAADGRVIAQSSGMNQKTLDDPVKMLAEFEQWVKERMPPAH